MPGRGKAAVEGGGVGILVVFLRFKLAKDLCAAQVEGR